MVFNECVTIERCQFWRKHMEMNIPYIQACNRSDQDHRALAGTVIDDVQYPNDKIMTCILELLLNSSQRAPRSKDHIWNARQLPF